MQKTLGILLTSERHGVHLEAIVRSAKRKRIQLYVHISGPAVLLCLKQSFQAALRQTKMTICSYSADRFNIKEKLTGLYPEAVTSFRRRPLDIGQCTRRIVL